MNRRGFTLTELLMAFTIMAVVGVALTRILISDSRFVSRQDAMLAARQGARAALNTVVAELQLVPDSGLISPTTNKKITARVPYAFGITCRDSSSFNYKIASLMPVDSLTFASAVPAGLVYRQTAGTYNNVYSGDYIHVEPATFTVTTYPDTAAVSFARCQQDSVRVIPGGKLIKITQGGSNQKKIDSVTVFMLYQNVTYEFKASKDLPGRTGLWRTVVGDTAELVTPFDTSAGFAFLVGGPTAATLTRQSTPPANLNTVRGLELLLYAASQSTAEGTSEPQTFKLKTRIMFTNKVS